MMNNEKEAEQTWLRHRLADMKPWKRDRFLRRLKAKEEKGKV
jgi:hypothetical protein